MAYGTPAGAPPRLVVTTPAQLSGAVLVLPIGRSVLGRAPGSLLRLDDPHVSRTHAALVRDPGGATVEDLGSTGGTRVNGVPVAGVRRLRHGDVVRFGTVEARFEELGQSGAPTMVGTMQPIAAAGTAPMHRPAPAERPALAERPAPAARFDIGPQGAGTINNVGGDQYNHILQQRESFLREIAATKTRARRLVQVGLVVFVVGFVLATVGMLQYSGSITDAAGEIGRSVGEQSPEMPGLDLDFGAFRLALIGGALCNVGVIVMLVGLVMHVVAASRRRRLDDRFRRTW